MLPNFGIFEKENGWIGDLYGITGYRESSGCLFFYRKDEQVAGFAKSRLDILYMRDQIATADLKQWAADE